MNIQTPESVLFVLAFAFVLYAVVTLINWFRG